MKMEVTSYLIGFNDDSNVCFLLEINGFNPVASGIYSVLEQLAHIHFYTRTCCEVLSSLLLLLLLLVLAIISGPIIAVVDSKVTQIGSCYV